jgi:hypothetical protein
LNSANSDSDKCSISANPVNPLIKRIGVQTIEIQSERSKPCQSIVVIMLWQDLLAWVWVWGIGVSQNRRFSIFFIMKKGNIKSIFKKSLASFTETLKQYVSTENGEWSVKGFIDVYKNIYTILNGILQYNVPKNF